MNIILNTIIYTLIYLVVGFSCISSSFAADIGVLRGKIIDVKDTPVTGADVYIYDSKNVKRPADYISNKTGVDGTYSVAVPEGRYWAVARQRTDNAKFGPLSPGDKHSGDPEIIEISSGQDLAKNFIVADIREAALLSTKKREDYTRINGRIIDEKGKPVALAYAIANSRKTYSEIPEHVSTWTNVDGQFSLYLPKGDFFLGASKHFPPEQDCVLNLKVTSETVKKNIDIIINCSLEPTKN